MFILLSRNMLGIRSFHTIAARASQLSELKSLLSKAKKKLASIKKEVKEAEGKDKLKAKKLKAKEAEIKAKAKEKKLIAAATKPFRRLSAFNYYIKQNVTATKPLREVSEAWKVLSDNEKATFQREADAYNEEQLQIFKPKPKSPAGGFAAFVKENFQKDGRSMAEITRELAGKWKQFAEEEKSKYAVTESDLQKHAEKLKAWTEERLSLFKK